MVYDFLALSQEEKDMILSGKKRAQVYFANLCGKEFKRGDKLVFLFPQDYAFGIGEIINTRACLFSDIDLDKEWPLTGFYTLEQIMRYGQENHPNFQIDAMSLYIEWGELIRPEEISEKATTRLTITEKLLRARDRASGKGTAR